MSQDNKELHGDNPGASDGDTGLGQTLRHDDEARATRRMVADTGSWSSGRLPRFSSSAFGMLDQDGGVSGSTF
jgi:hypothetical protein